jgi:hypothetical protein
VRIDNQFMTSYQPPPARYHYTRNHDWEYDGKETNRGRIANYVFVYVVSLFVIFIETIIMKGVSYITDESNRKKAVVIEMSLLKKHDCELEDLLDGIIADSRKNDEKIPLDSVIANLKKSGKLK